MVELQNIGGLRQTKVNVVACPAAPGEAGEPVSVAAVPQGDDITVRDGRGIAPWADVVIVPERSEWDTVRAATIGDRREGVQGRVVIMIMSLRPAGSNLPVHKGIASQRALAMTCGRSNDIHH